MTNAELAVLGLVVERPRHGYEIEQVIEERGMRNWTEIGFSSIYYLLKKLEGEGLVFARIDTGQTKGPARKVFEATRKGRKVWRTETRRALATPKQKHPEILLGMAGMPGLGPDQIVGALSQYLEGLADRLVQITEARERSGTHLPDHVEAMFSYSEAMIAAEQSWVTRFIREFGHRRKELA